MKCKLAGRLPHPCRQCMYCRINRQREWAYRILLESRSSPHNAFVTLTYSQPSNTLEPRHVQLFLKRLRKAHPSKIRFFAVGEYGDQNQRPHYHLALFGFPTCSNLRTLHSIQQSCCYACDRIRSIWGKGLIDVGELNAQSAQYIGGYVTKKLTNPYDITTRKWLNGRHPEFARISLKPGIGSDAAAKISDSLITAELFPHQSCPSALLENGRSIYLGRTLKKKIANFNLNKDTQDALRTLSQQIALNQEIQAYQEQISQGLSPLQISQRKQDIQKQILTNQQRKLEMRQKRRPL